MFWSIVIQGVILAYLDLTIYSGIGSRFSAEPDQAKKNFVLVGIVAFILIGILLSTYYS